MTPVAISIAAVLLNKHRQRRLHRHANFATSEPLLDITIIRVISSKPNQGNLAMSSITIRNLPEETHRALRLRASLAGRSTEAEVRAILEQAARPLGRIQLGSLLAEIGQQAGGFDLDLERDKTPAEPMRFE
jgi:plasmid stability protein